MLKFQSCIQLLLWEHISTIFLLKILSSDFSIKVIKYVRHSHKPGNKNILGKKSFWCLCLEAHFSFNFKFILLLLFWDMTISVQDLERCHWKCDFEKSAFSVSYSYSFGFDMLQKMYNNLFCTKMFENQSEITWRY